MCAGNIASSALSCDDQSGQGGLPGESLEDSSKKEMGIQTKPQHKRPQLSDPGFILCPDPQHTQLSSPVMLHVILRPDTQQFTRF